MGKCGGGSDGENEEADGWVDGRGGEARTRWFVCLYVQRQTGVYT